MSFVAPPPLKPCCDSVLIHYVSHSGHTFQAIVRSEADAGWYTTPSNDTDSPVPIPAIPMRRDVLMVRPNGHYVIRFRSDNPGVGLLPSLTIYTSY